MVRKMAARNHAVTATGWVKSGHQRRCLCASGMGLSASSQSLSVAVPICSRVLLVSGRVVGMRSPLDGEALCALFDDGVVVGDKGRLDDDVVVFGAADAQRVGVDAVDVVLVFDGQFCCHVICSSRCAMTRLPRFSWMPVSIMVMVKPCCFTPICAAMR